MVPFLRNVVRGKGVPEERLVEVGEHYYAFGGKSPINEQNIDLQQALQTELARRGLELPVVWGNRNWHPYTTDVLRDAHAFGARRILVLLTSAYASYSNTRQYHEHLAQALTDLGEIGEQMTLDVVRPFFNDPGFIAANAEAIIEVGADLPGGLDGAHIAYVTHSIPITMQQASEVSHPGYLQQHEDVRATIDADVAKNTGANVSSSLSYCSRSGPPSVPWLEPDINDHLEELAKSGVEKVVIAPIGFISDHMEVIWDLDTEAVGTAKEHGLEVVRSSTAGIAPVFVTGLVDMIVERAARERGDTPAVPTRGKLGAYPDVARADANLMQHGKPTGNPVVATAQQ